MFRKIINSIKFWIGYYPPELKEADKRRLETNRIYQQALDKVQKSPKPAVKRKPAAKKVVAKKKAPVKKAVAVKKTVKAKK